MCRARPLRGGVLADEDNDAADGVAVAAASGAAAAADGGGSSSTVVVTRAAVTTEVLAKHAQFTETQALLQESLGSSKAKSGNPLAPSNLYR